MSEFSQRAYEEDILMEVFDHLKRVDVVQYNGKLSSGELEEEQVEDVCMDVIGRARGTVVFYLSVDEVLQVLEWSENVPDEFTLDVDEVESKAEVSDEVYEVVYEDIVDLLRSEGYLEGTSYVFTESAFEDMVYREDFERETEPMV